MRSTWRGNLLYCGNCKERDTEINPVKWRPDLEAFMCETCYDEYALNAYEQEFGRSPQVRV